MELNDFGYLDAVVGNLERVRAEQAENIAAAASLMADAIAEDRLIHVYGGGGHTTLVMGEMFFRAGGLANIDPVMETGLSVFNQALKYLELERTGNYGAAIVKYYELQEDDLLIIFHNIGINAATIDAALEAKRAGAKIVAVSSSLWQKEMPPEHHIRHCSGKNLFELADVCIDDCNPVGDAVVTVPASARRSPRCRTWWTSSSPTGSRSSAFGSASNAGLTPPVWRSANAPGGDEFNAANLKKYRPRIKNL